MKKSIAFAMGAALLLSIFASGCSSWLPIEPEPLPPPLIEPSRTVYVAQKVERKTIEKKITGYGNVIAENQKDIFFDISGRLRVIYPEYGDWVEEGDLLCEFDNSSLREKIETTEMQQYINELRFQKAERQYKAGEIDEIDWETAKMNITLSRRTLNALYDDLLKTQLHAPVSGYVVFITETAYGALVTDKDKIFTIADTNSLIVEYKGIQGEEIPVGAICTGVFRRDPKQEKILFSVITSPHTNKDKTPLRLICEQEYGDWVRLGDTVELTYLIARAENVVVIPRRATHTREGRTYVYVLEGEAKTERTITIGLEGSSELEVLSGLEEGEEIIY